MPLADQFSEEELFRLFVEWKTERLFQWACPYCHRRIMAKNRRRLRDAVFDHLRIHRGTEK